MKLITRDTDYAVRALCYFANHKNKIISVTELVKELKIPQPFLRKILQFLNKNGILHSYKGQGGGFSLLVSAEKIRLIDLIMIFQGPLELNECLFKKKVCPNKGVCRLRHKINEIEEKVLKEIGFITIESLIK